MAHKRYTYKNRRVALDLILAGKLLVDSGINSTKLGGALELAGSVGPFRREVLAMTAPRGC